MAKHSIFDDMDFGDASYMLDPTVEAAKAVDEAAETKTEQTVEGEEIVKQAQADAVTLPIDRLKSFKNHPFRVDTDNEDFKRLCGSIKDNGIIVPLLVRKKGKDYEIISGHRRLEAAREAGLTEVPVVVRKLNDIDATITMVHSNYYREKLLPSEKARAYKMCIEAEKHRGKKGGETAEKAGGKEDSTRQVYRYARLTELVQGLLDLVDSGKLAMNAGVELADLNAPAQEVVLDYINETEKPITCDNAAALKEKFKEDEDGFSKETIIATLLSDDNKGSAKKSTVSFKVKEIQEFFGDDVAPEEMGEIILSLLRKYHAGEI